VNPLPPRLERIASDIARELDSRLSELAEQWYARMSGIAELDPWGGPELYDVAIANARRDMGREIAGLVAGRRLPVSCPDEVVQSARLAARAGFPLWACAQSYRAGHAVQWQAYSDAVEARRLDAEGRRLLLQAVSEYMFSYADRCSRWVELEYTRERDRRVRGEEQLRIQLVRDLLEGKVVDSRRLGYELDGWHLAMIASGRAAERLVAELGEGLDAELLTVAAEAATFWAWARLPGEAAAALDRLWRDLAMPPNTSLAIGEPCEGASGFRFSHAQAEYARAIGTRRGQSAARYHDLALEALTTADHDHAEAFVTRELGPLGRDDHRSRILRETLRAYFSVGQRASSTAAILGVHERTIGNRLRVVEGMIGHPVHGRRAELEIALRIWDLVCDRQP
jgi:hypothetical protein